MNPQIEINGNKKKLRLRKFGRMKWCTQKKWQELDHVWHIYKKETIFLEEHVHVCVNLEDNFNIHLYMYIYINSITCLLSKIIVLQSI